MRLKSNRNNTMNSISKLRKYGIVNYFNKYEFTKDEILYLLEINGLFREAFLSGAYILCQNRICINNPDNFVISENGMQLTERVFLKPERYLISKQWINFSLGRKVPGRRYKPRVRTQYIQINHAADYYKLGFTSEKEYNQVLSRAATAIHMEMNDRILTNNPDVLFCDAFSKCVNESGYTATDLEEMTGISYKTIMRMMNEKEYNPSLEYVVACSLVLGLVPDDSFELVNLAGYSLRASIEKEKVFKSLLLNCFEMRSLEYCDDVLKVLKFPTLSSYIKSRKKEK